MSVPNSPPRAPPIKYSAPLGTRWQKEKAAAGHNAFDLPDDPKYVGPWVIGECVGKGASGRVKIAKHRRTGQLAAVKILPLQPIVNSRASLATQQAKSEKQRLGIDREITMMKLMNHPNIMRIYDVYEGDKELYLILEYVEGGELFDYLVNHGKLRTLQALAYFKQIVYGLNYAHTFAIIHRDLKPENILIQSFNPPLIKIADWGMAAFAPPDRQLDTSCGSPHYASPEIVNGSKYEGTATDIWSCGVILFALVTGRLPFDDKNVRTLLSKVKVGKYEVPAYVDPQAKDLITRMLVVDVAKRITMPEILAHPWLQNDTPGITYLPAPSLAELAQPLLSPAHVDRELLESLRVIWGKGADVQVIKTDLLSPPGYGSLAKAFYFLLQRHRECALQERGILMDIQNEQGKQEKAVMKPYTVPSPKPKASLTLDIDSIIHPQRLRPVRMATAPPVAYEQKNVALNLNVSAAPRYKPNSPVGPRPRPTSSPLGSRTHSSHSAIPVPVPGIIRPHIEAPAMARNSTAPAAAPAYAEPDVFTSSPISMPARRYAPASVPHVYHDFPLMSAPAGGRGTPQSPSGFVHAPIPQYPETGGSMPVLAANRVTAAEMESHLYYPVSDANVLAPRENTAPAHPPVYQPEYECSQQYSTPGHAHGHPYARTQPYLSEYSGRSQSQDWVVSSPDGNGYREDLAYSENKENRGGNVNPMQSSGGLGFGKVNAGDVKNHGSGHVAFSAEVGRERRERRQRPPPLDFQAPPMSRRSTFSSSTKASPLMSPHSGSPVVGEFKGWFSNLFSWKQSYILYSVNDLFTAQRETIRILEQAGVFVMMEDSEGVGILKCRMDDITDSMAIVLQKSVRFRVEFSGIPASGVLSAHQQRLPPSQVPVSSSRMSSHASSMLAKNSLKNLAGMGYACALVLIQEKGAVSTFRLIYKRLREEWRLDGIHSPMLGGGSALMDGVQRVMA